MRRLVLVSLATLLVLPAVAGALTDAERKCQTQVAKFGQSFIRTAGKALRRCQDRISSGALAAGTDCTIEPRAASGIALATQRFTDAITRRCPDGVVASLVFGGSCFGATTASELASCQVAEHQAQVVAMVRRHLRDAAGAERREEAVRGGRRARGGQVREPPPSPAAALQGPHRPRLRAAHDGLHGVVRHHAGRGRVHAGHSGPVQQRHRSNADVRRALHGNQHLGGPGRMRARHARRPCGSCGRGRVRRQPHGRRLRGPADHRHRRLRRWAAQPVQSERLSPGQRPDPGRRAGPAAQSSRIGAFGGQIIDADIVRTAGPDRDNFEEMSTAINLENTAHYTNITVLNDGSDGQAAVIRVTGVDDLLDLINPSSALAGFNLPFPASANDVDLPIEVLTDYILEPGRNYVRMETTLQNLGGTQLKIFFGDFLNGSGQAALWQPGYGFGEPLVTTRCPAAAPNPCNFFAYEGYKGGAGVSYGYIDSGSTRLSTFTTVGVSVPLIGTEVILALLGSAQPNHVLEPFGMTGDSKTITRHFVVGGGTVQSVVDARNEIQFIPTGDVVGTVTVGGAPRRRGGRHPDRQRHGRAGIREYRPQRRRAHFDRRRGPVSSVGRAGGLHGRGEPGGRSVRRQWRDARIACGRGRSVPERDPEHRTAGDRRHPGERDGRGRRADRRQGVGGGLRPERGSGEHAGRRRGQQSYGGVQRPAGGWYPVRSLAGALHGYERFDGTLPIEPGNYRVVLSHGPEYSSASSDVAVVAGATTPVAGQITRVLDTTGFVGSDFHVHSIDSADAQVSRVDRVVSLLAEGVDFFTPSDHEFRADFAPTIAALGGSSLLGTATGNEITTFDYGTFQCLADDHRPAQVNGGAVDHGGAAPAGLDFPSRVTSA
jgi:hypothetical protein